MKRIEKLNNLFFTYMCGQDPHDADAEAGEGGLHLIYDIYDLIHLQTDISLSLRPRLCASAARYGGPAISC